MVFPSESIEGVPFLLFNSNVSYASRRPPEVIVSRTVDGRSGDERVRDLDGGS